MNGFCNWESVKLPNRFGGLILTVSGASSGGGGEGGKVEKILDVGLARIYFPVSCSRVSARVAQRKEDNHCLSGAASFPFYCGVDFCGAVRQICGRPWDRLARILLLVKTPVVWSCGLVGSRGWHDCTVRMRDDPRDANE